MFGSLFSNLGGALGKNLGGGILSSVGRYAGRAVGNYLDSQMMHKTITSHKFVNVKDGFYLNSANYGSPIPLIFGRMKVPGQIIWISNVKEKQTNNLTSSYFKGKNVTLEKHTSLLEYYANFAMALCEGEIADIGRVWFKEQEINLNQYKFKLYKGTEDQMPDPLIVKLSDGAVPAYRGLAYIVFEELPLVDFNDTIPTLSFEITRKSKINKDASVEDMVNSMVIIPGSGEYVYDSAIQKKSSKLQSGIEYSRDNINCHNHYNIANSVLSLNQLQDICKNIKWVSPVACWFGNNIDARYCTIKPAIEFRDSDDRYSTRWSVGKYNRNNAYEISKDNEGNPSYGGSVNDESIVRYLIEIKKRGLKIMFYPMVLLDVTGKPWRGHINTKAEYISEFFQKKDGYNEFILHYANLVKNYIDAFVIGSELIGLTKVQNDGFFPAVEELIQLSQKVKDIVGPNVLVTYAADWSEYHHTEGGWYNLDPLWASTNIDFIGIDAYFPVTNSTSSIITREEILKGFQSGEGYDYYINHSNDKEYSLDPAYAWKNIRYWWENKHVNPDGEVTKWVPKSKSIWFTEFGFPSIDKATNQPNIFFDPKCRDGGAPRNSNGATDFSIQRKAIRAFIEYWGNEEYIDQMFLWCWDARPYPSWPHSDFWGDGNLWEKGHWVNNKFGSSNLPAILLDISDRCGIDINHINLDEIDDSIDGIIFNNQISAIDAINTLRTAYFFDIYSGKNEIISFKKRGQRREINLTSDICLKQSQNNFIEEIEIPKEMILDSVDMYFINQNKDYDQSYIYLNNEANSCAATEIIHIPIAMTKEEAYNVGKLILKNAATEEKIIKFLVNLEMVQLKPTDFVILSHKNQKYYIRVTDVKSDSKQVSTIIGIVDHRINYFTTPNAKQQLKTENLDIKKDLVILELSFDFLEKNEPFILVYLRNNNSTALYANISNMGENWSRVANISPSYSAGKIVGFEENKLANIFMIDNKSKFIIKGHKLEQNISDDWQFCMVGEELIRFKKLKKLENGLYQISCLSRGEHGCEEFILKHNLGEDFAIINNNANFIPISEKLINKNVEFKAAGIKKSIIYQNKWKKPINQQIVQQVVVDNILFLKWTVILKENSDWLNEESYKNTEFSVLIKNKNYELKYNTKQNRIEINLADIDLEKDYLVRVAL